MVVQGVVSKDVGEQTILLPYSKIIIVVGGRKWEISGRNRMSEQRKEER